MFTRKTWFWFVFTAGLSLLAWLRLAYPQLAFTDLSVNRNTAFKIACTFLKDIRQVDPKKYHKAIVFVATGGVDVYLQKAVGFKAEVDFLKKYQFDLFYWRVRFFREQEKEEHTVLVSAATGEVTDYTHTIEDNASRPDEGKETSQKIAKSFLQEKFLFNLDGDFSPNGDLTKKYDNRKEYSWLWERNGVFIQWSNDRNDGGAKLMTSAVVTGSEVLSFFKYKFMVPDQFYRHLAKLRSVGENVSVIFRYIFLGLFITTVFFILLMRNNLVLHTVKRFAIGLAAAFFILDVLSEINHTQIILFGYPTTVSFFSYCWQHISNFLINAFKSSLMILLPCLAAEALHAQVFPEKKSGRFLPYLRSSLLSRGVARLIGLGYLTAVIMFGIQSVAFAVGEKYLGVWTEHIWMTSLSANTFPFLAAFSLGFTASISEEIFFRVFGITLGKKYFKKTFPAVLVASIIWGYGHSNYPVFPMWFRGLEVTCLGLLLSYVYLRFGIIPVLVGHYLFDVFWYNAAFILGKTTPFYFYNALAALLLPLAWGLWAYWRNEMTPEKPLRWNLNRHQIFNLEILKNFIRSKGLLSHQTSRQIKEEVTAHGWDPAVVDVAFEDLDKEQNS